MLEQGITIQFYASRLGDPALQELSHIARDHIQAELPSLRDWLVKVIKKEVKRRDAWRADILWEPTLPTITADWSDKEMALAMMYSYCIVKSSRDRDLQTFGHELLKFFIALSSRRLQELERTESPTTSKGKAPRKRSTGKKASKK